MFQSINPATEDVLESYATTSRAEARAKLDQSAAAWECWRSTSYAERSGVLNAASVILRQHRERYARLVTAEMGKPIQQARAEIDKCALCCDYYAEHGAKFLQPREVATDASRCVVRFDPIGLVLAIMPWNFPFWQVFRCAVPALMAGNGVVLKHAPNVWGSALAIEEVFRQAGLPDGLLTALFLDHDDFDIPLQHPAVQAVSLTGSERAGRQIAAAAGREIKKCVLELGGSDPFLILADADLKQVAAHAVRARCQNSGQSCIAAKRFFVEESVAEEFTQEFARLLEQLQVGDPLDEKCDIGPLARRDLVETLAEQVDRSVAEGARLLTGGKRIAGRGYFYQPTLLSDVRPGMAAFDEETFGPVAAVIKIRSSEEGIKLANQSRYGLGASIWTRNLPRGWELAAELQAGSVFINELVKSEPRVPFGGVKNSGYGRELAEYGLHEFVNIKTVWMR